MAVSRWTLAFLLASLVGGSSASADTILFNSFGPGGSFSGNAFHFGFDPGEEGDPDTRSGLAFPFVPSVTGTFRTAELPLFLSSLALENNVVINLFESEGDLPGRLLESILRTDPVDEIVSFPSSVQPQLLAGRTYFLEATTAGLGTYLWNHSPVPPGSFLGLSRVNGGPWRTDVREFTAAFRIAGETPPAPIPEPSTILLLGGGLAAAAVRRRMTKKLRTEPPR
jgi:hypothetical protein